MSQFRFDIFRIARCLRDNFLQCTQHFHANLSNQHGCARSASNSCCTSDLLIGRDACRVHCGQQDAQFERVPGAFIRRAHQPVPNPLDRGGQLRARPKRIERGIDLAGRLFIVLTRVAGGRAQLVAVACGAPTMEIDGVVAQRMLHESPKRPLRGPRGTEQASFKNHLHQETLDRLLSMLKGPSVLPQPLFAGSAVTVREFVQRALTVGRVIGRGGLNHGPSGGGK